MISKNIVVTKIVKFRSLLLILKQITSVFAIIINLFIWHFYSLPYYCIQFPIGRYASKTHMHICFEENDTKVCFYNYESCHKINTLRLFYHAFVATVYEWLIQISSCSLAVLWTEQVIFGDDVLYQISSCIMARTSHLRWWCFVLSWILILLIFCVMFYRSLIVPLSLFFRQLYCLVFFGFWLSLCYLQAFLCSKFCIISSK